MWPDLRRLADVLVLHRPTPPASWRRPLARRWMRIAHPIAKYSFLAIYLGMLVWPNVKPLFAKPPKPSPDGWLDGYWTVTSFLVDGQANEDPNTRWRRFKFERDDERLFMRWHLDKTVGPLYTLVLDAEQHTMTLNTEPDGPDLSDPKKVGTKYSLALTKRDGEHFHLEGVIDGKRYAVDAEQLHAEHMLLLDRGFHWVNEVPFNR
jgi:hypothetical protein